MAINNTTTVSYSTMPSDEPEPEPQRQNETPQGTSDASHASVDLKHLEPNVQSKKSIRKKTHNHHSYTRLTDILLAFAIVFVPMAGISLILLGLTFYGPVRAQFPGIENEADGLSIPPNTLPPTNAYYTTVGVATFLAVGSWSSTVAEAVIAPFTLMFSFFIAQMALRRAVQDSAGPSNELRAILKTPYQGSWHWVKSSLTRSGRKKNYNMLSTYLAGFGVLFAILLTILVIAGDQWLHYTTTEVTFRYYNTTGPSLPVSDTDDFAPYFNTSSYALNSTCYDQADADLLCSLTKVDNVTNVATPENAYLVLLTGINRDTSDFQFSDFGSIQEMADNNEGTTDQIITYYDPNTALNHSMFFNLFSALQFANYSFSDLGLDYVANSISMATSCDSATYACHLRNVTNPSAPDQQLLYNCNPFFHGDLDASNTSSPTASIEAVRGWSTSFYNLADGTYQPTPLNASLNDFTFTAVVDLNSYPYSSFSSFAGSYIENGDVIDAGSDHLAFALNCTATVFDVTFSFINGSITNFNATPSDDRTAGVIRAPLQAGFGANYLYQQATFSTISTGDLNELMAIAFSQAGIAGSAGVFVKGPNIRQRVRYDWMVTSVNKAALIFQATVCMLYAAVGLALMILGLTARRSEAVREYQVKLLPLAIDKPRSLRSWLSKFVEWSGENVDGVDDAVEVVKEEVDNQRERKGVEREDGVGR